MIQFRDRNLLPQQSSRHKSSLPEFVAKGGGQGIFTLPDRKPLHPNRPPHLEVRPHPLTETQFGRFLKTIDCTDRQLWEGSESGAVRVWELKNLYEEGEEEAAPPFRESTALLSNGNGNGNGNANAAGSSWPSAVHGFHLLWLGRGEWVLYTTSVLAGPGEEVPRLGADASVDEDGGLKGNGNSTGDLAFGLLGAGARTVTGGLGEEQNVYSRAISASLPEVACYNFVPASSEGGNIRIWPWEDIQKALSLTVEERHMASLLMGRSFIDLRSQVAVNGFSSILNSDIKCLLSDNIRAKVRSSGYLSFALWDARTRELLKVFNNDGQIENRADLSLVPDFAMEDEMKIVASSKKEKTQSSFGFFQQSRNAIMGAADAVRRVAAKGFLDDSRRIEALTITIDGMIWVGCANGLLIQWDGNGNRIQDIHPHPSAVLCLCSFGSKIWAGYASGIVHALDLDGNKLGEWVAHSSSVLRMAIGAGYIYTLAKHGGIRGWSITSPGTLDGILRWNYCYWIAKNPIWFKIFQGMREAVITFAPTYKFDKHVAGLSGYDSGEKNLPGVTESYTVIADELWDLNAVYSVLLYLQYHTIYPVNSVSEYGQYFLRIMSTKLPPGKFSMYESCMDVTDSDHKPVICIFSVEIAHIDDPVSRQEFGDIVRSNEEVRSKLQELCKIPETVVSTNNILLQTQDTSILRITNKCTESVALFEIVCQGESTIKGDGKASYHRPRGYKNVERVRRKEISGAWVISFLLSSRKLHGKDSACKAIPEHLASKIDQGKYKRLELTSEAKVSAY
ncbi:Type II inositol 1,4,5-trisphosphate 5-phosphatase FRA3 [Hibiscus syriacus]|uniref:Type II inositol 1,4,5-trisphosphate 5-phosphatase FRA3 n=1 Tax=Hibiscus syriacus TaxID=106335 RepID=A0A6A3CYA8_HIBSY|nr:Type II inositol 1,4,5-trisphosphate 5-phosphatase FRA3 [Hibiscus syriacus]